MKRFLIYFVVCSFLLGCRYKGLPPLNESFSFTDKNPFGTYVLKKLLGQSFPKAKMNIINSINEIKTDKKSLYFSVSQKFAIDQDDLNKLLNYVNDGNIVFISAYKIEPDLLNFFDSSLRIKRQYLNYMVDYKQTDVSLVKPDGTFIKFNYYYNGFENSFIKGANKTDIKGLNELNEPNFIKINYGNGEFYFHSDPRAFSNYFILSNNNYLYLEKVLNIIKADPTFIYWVSLSKRNFNSKESAWDKLMKQPALANAIWIVICLLIAYIIFESRRKQKIIPVEKSNKNDSIEFARVISGLYLAKKDNRNIALKMISYFNEYCRNKFFIKENVSNQDPVFIAGKTGKSLDEVKEIIDTISVIENSIDVSDDLLISLQNQIHNFHK